MPSREPVKPLRGYQQLGIQNRRSSAIVAIQLSRRKGGEVRESWWPPLLEEEIKGKPHSSSAAGARNFNNHHPATRAFGARRVSLKIPWQ